MNRDPSSKSIRETRRNAQSSWTASANSVLSAFIGRKIVINFVTQQKESFSILERMIQSLDGLQRLHIFVCVVFVHFLVNTGRN